MNLSNLDWFCYYQDVALYPDSDSQSSHEWLFESSPLLKVFLDEDLDNQEWIGELEKQLVEVDKKVEPEFGPRFWDSVVPAFIIPGVNLDYLNSNYRIKPGFSELSIIVRSMVGIGIQLSSPEETEEILTDIGAVLLHRRYSGERLKDLEDQNKQDDFLQDILVFLGSIVEYGNKMSYRHNLVSQPGIPAGPIADFINNELDMGDFGKNSK